MAETDIFTNTCHTCFHDANHRLNIWGCRPLRNIQTWSKFPVCNHPFGELFEIITIYKILWQDDLDLGGLWRDLAVLVPDVSQHHVLHVSSGHCQCSDHLQQDHDLPRCHYMQPQRLQVSYISLFHIFFAILFLATQKHIMLSGIPRQQNLATMSLYMTSTNLVETTTSV